MFEQSKNQKPANPGWRQLLFPSPRPHRSRRPTTHTFCFCLLPLISQLPCGELLHCLVLGEHSMTGVSSHDPPTPGSTRGHGFKGMEMSNFFVLFSFQNLCLLCGGGDRRACGRQRVLLQSLCKSGTVSRCLGSTRSGL